MGASGGEEEYGLQSGPLIFGVFRHIFIERRRGGVKSKGGPGE